MLGALLLLYLFCPIELSLPTYPFPGLPRRSNQMWEPPMGGPCWVTGSHGLHLHQAFQFCYTDLDSLCSGSKHSSFMEHHWGAFLICKWGFYFLLYNDITVSINRPKSHYEVHVKLLTLIVFREAEWLDSCYILFHVAQHIQVKHYPEVLLC